MNGKIETGIFFIICMTCILPLALSRCSDRPSVSATLVLRNGNIITLEPDNPGAEAVAVRGDTILAVREGNDIPIQVSKRC